MLKLIFLFTLTIPVFTTKAQTSDSTRFFADDLKKLIALNRTEGVHDFSGKEAIHLSNASASQIIEITAPYHQSGILNAKGVCFYLLSHLLFTKTESEQQKQKIVEIICANYLASDYEVQVNDNVLLQLKEKDFTPTAKKHIAALIDSIPPFSYASCAKLSAIAQVKESIPALWKIAKRDIAAIQRADIDVLASLARMGEKEAGILLCNYYSSDLNKKERPGLATKSYVSFSEQLKFSLDKNVLDCLIADFKNFDLEFRERGNDYFWWPGQHLGIRIADMLTNYPYPKSYKLDPYQLLEWLNSTDRYELIEK